MCVSTFFLNDAPTTEITPLPLHDALPISVQPAVDRDAGQFVELAGLHHARAHDVQPVIPVPPQLGDEIDRKSTRLNSSHSQISYAVFCLKKKNNYTTQ